MDTDGSIVTPDTEYLAWIKERIDTSPFHSWSGLRLTELGDGTAEVTVVLDEHHLNPYGIVHGGMLGSIADAAIGIALRTRLSPGWMHVTAQLSVNFLGMVRYPGTVIGRGTAIHVGAKMGYGEAELVDQDGELVAKASATFIVLPPRDET